MQTGGLLEECIDCDDVRIRPLDPEQPEKHPNKYCAHTPVRRACCQPFSIVVQFRVVLHECTSQFHPKASKKGPNMRQRSGLGSLGHAETDFLFPQSTGAARYIVLIST
jgi:hypothetical protein